MKNKNYRTLLWIIAGTGLILTILPPILVFTNSISFNLHVTLMALGMVLWFGSRITMQVVRDTSEVDNQL